LKIACIGGAHIDRHAVLKGPPVPATSNPGNVSTSFGGVARNVAENLARLGRAVAMVSRVGSDEAGRAVVSRLQSLGIDTSMIGVADGPTASYTAILEPGGELVFGLADMDLYDEITPALLDRARLGEHGFWFADTNLPAETLSWLVDQGPPVAVDAISVAKSRKLCGLLPRASILFGTVAQAAAIAQTGSLSNPEEAARALYRLGARAGVVTAGAAGIAVWDGDDVRQLPILPAEPKDVTGAGDALIAGTLFGVTGGRTLAEAALLGLAAAAITVESGATVAENLTAELLYARLAANRR
jgi:pseudouridine kinase